MKNWILVLLLVACFFGSGVRAASAASMIEDKPNIDLVAMYAGVKDTLVSGVRLTNIMNVRYSQGKISDIYNKIYYTDIQPNQIICKSSWMLDEKTGKIAPTVMWSVWYRPGAMVSKIGTECVDSLAKPWIILQWFNQGYRWLGSGVEPHMHLQWLNSWVQYQRAIMPSYTWCKAAGFSYVKWTTGEWTKVYSKAVFDYNAAIMASALISRDVTCTSDASLYGKWMRTPGWSYVFINP